MFEAHETLEADVIGLPVKMHDADGIAEDVVDVADVDRLRLDDNRIVENVLIEAFARAQHHPMLAKTDGAGVAVAREMADGQKIHGRGCSTG